MIGLGGGGGICADSATFIFIPFICDLYCRYTFSALAAKFTINIVDFVLLELRVGIQSTCILKDREKINSCDRKFSKFFLV